MTAVHKRPTAQTRPTIMDNVIGRDAAGGPVTVGDRVIDGVRMGLPRDAAAASAGISERTVIGWRTKGRLCLAMAAAGAVLSHNQGRFAEFAERLAAADAECMMRAVTNIQKAANEGYQVRKTTTVVRTDANDVVIDKVTTTTVEQHPAQWLANAWMLTHRFQRQFAMRINTEAVEDGRLDPDDNAADLRDALREMIETTGTEVDDA